MIVCIASLIGKLVGLAYLLIVGKRMKERKLLVTVYLITSAILLMVFLWWHFRLGMVRYFDVDEFAHLHWASHMAMGKKPYIDFLYFFPPGYQWFLEPLFWVGKGIAPILAARFVQFVVFVLLVGTTGILFWITRKSLWAAVFTGAILAYLPLPYDKFLEIRPDTLAALLAMLGMVFQIYWMRYFSKRAGFLAGCCYALSLLILPKTAPAVGVAGIVALLHARDSSTKRIGRTNTIFSRESLAALGAGFGIPFLFFGLWILFLGDLGTVMYSLTKLPIEANKISQTFIMMPDLFFYPNQIFYGTAGYSFELLANHVIWVVACAIGLFRLFLPYFIGKERALEELLIAGTFITHVIFYIQLVPLKHTQYLIPIAPFIAYFLVDGIVSIWNRVKQWESGRVGFSVAFIAIALLLFMLNSNSVTPKLAWTNTDVLKELAYIFKTIPFDQPILDLDGRTLYYPDPYIACCLPFGQSAPYLSKPLPSLSQTLESSKTKYIYQGELKRVTTLVSEDQDYISKHYKNWDSEWKMLVRL